MRLDTIFVALLSIGGIISTYWFFLAKKDTEAVVIDTGDVDILVDGGYSPTVISIPKGKQTVLHFVRKDPSSCLEEVVIPEFKIRLFLPLGVPTSVSITPRHSGTFAMSCGMNMFHGKIIVH